LNSGLENSNSAADPSFIVEYLVQLMQTGTNSITNDKVHVYLNLVDSHPIIMQQYLEIFSYNQKYGIKIQYPYYWSIDGNSYPAAKIGMVLEGVEEVVKEVHSYQRY